MMSVPILSRHTGGVIFQGTKETLGETVVEALGKVLSLFGADLRAADLSRADLQHASGAVVASGDGWIFVIWERDGHLQIEAGCHSFTVAEARSHWSSESEHDKLSLVAVDCLCSMAEARGWAIDQKETEVA